MNPYTDLVDRYIAVWNETDTAQRQTLIAQTWTEDGTYIDPMMQATGRDGINAMIQGVQTQFPHCRFRRTSDVEAHNNRLRFTWELGPKDGPPLAGGVDFGVLVGDHLQAITGFLDFVPTAAED